MKKLLGIFLLVGISACSNVNQPYRDEYQREKMRHGIIPMEGSAVQAKVDAKKNPLDGPNPTAVERGRMLYEKNCLECHGPKGLGDGPQALNQIFKPANLQKVAASVPHFKFFMMFSQSQGAMPGWKANLVESERDDLVEFIKTLK